MNIYILNMEDKQGNTFSPSIRANNYKDAVKLGRHLAKKEGCKFLSIRSKSINL